MIEWVGLAVLAFAIGLYPALEHFRKFEFSRERVEPPTGFRLLAELFSHAQHSIKVVTGELNPVVFNPLTSVIEGALRRNKHLTVSVIASDKIFTIGGVNKFHALWRSGVYGDRLQIVFTKNPQLHFGVIDTKFLYVEAPHSQTALERDVAVYRHSMLRAVEFTRKFDRLLAQVQAVPVEEVQICAHPLEAETSSEGSTKLQEYRATLAREEDLALASFQ